MNISKFILKWILLGPTTDLLNQNLWDGVQRYARLLVFQMRTTSLQDIIWDSWWKISFWIVVGDNSYACLNFGHLVTRGTDWPLFWILFSRMFVWQAALEDRDHNLPEKADFFTVWCNKNNFSQWGMLITHYKRFRLPKLGVPQLGAHSLQVSIHWGPSFVTLWGMWSRRNGHKYGTCAVSNKVICFWSRSLLSSSSIYKTMAG